MLHISPGKQDLQDYMEILDSRFPGEAGKKIQLILSDKKY